MKRKNFVPMASFYKRHKEKTSIVVVKPKTDKEVNDKLNIKTDVNDMTLGERVTSLSELKMILKAMYRRKEKPEIALIAILLIFDAESRLIARLKELEQDSFSDTMYVFCSKTKDKLKFSVLGRQCH